MMEDGSIDEKITFFFDDLLQNEEPLGDDFSKVLYENLWNLYQGE